MITNNSSIRHDSNERCNAGKTASLHPIASGDVATPQGWRAFRFSSLVLFAVFSQFVMRPVCAQMNPGRALAATCATCHGIDGQAKQGMMPLTGKSAAEIVVLMKAFRSGERHATIMQQIAKGYTDDQIELIAKYFSRQVVSSQAKP